MDEPGSDVRETRRNTRGAWLVVVAMAGIYILVTRPAALPEGWLEDFDAAQQVAQQAHQPMLIAFSMEGCAPCRVMERTVLPAAPVRHALADHVAVRVDVARDTALADRMGVYATPTYIVADEGGTPQRRAEGLLSVGEFVEFVQGTGRFAARRAEMSADAP